LPQGLSKGDAMSVPLKDAQLVAWAENADAKLTASPTTWGYTVPLAATFHTLTEAYTDSYAALVAAREDGTRSASMTATKDSHKLALLNVARPLYNAVQWSKTISDADKILLGVKVRSLPSPIGAPAVSPGMDLVTVVARSVRVHIHDSSSSSKRGKPAGVIGAKVYSFVGADYPTDPSLWSYEGDCTKPTFEVVFPDTVAGGAKVWICAAWYSRTALTGPISTPLMTQIQGGLTMAA
jgi:hypothetical protein